MSWPWRNVIQVEQHSRWGTHVVGRIGTRPCGCTWRLGIRLDNDELTFSATACAPHKKAARLALDELRDAPPSRQPVADFYEAALERRLEQGH